MPVKIFPGDVSEHMSKRDKIRPHLGPRGCLFQLLAVLGQLEDRLRHRNKSLSLMPCHDGLFQGFLGLSLGQLRQPSLDPLHPLDPLLLHRIGSHGLLDMSLRQLGGFHCGPGAQLPLHFGPRGLIFSKALHRRIGRVNELDNELSKRSQLRNYRYGILCCLILYRSAEVVLNDMNHQELAPFRDGPMAHLL